MAVPTLKAAVLAVVLIAATTQAEVPLPLCPGCNVILISIDTLRADAVGALGSARPTTPHLDAWAAQGRLFSLAFSQASNTFPSHMSIFSGLQPWHHGMNVPRRDRLLPGAETMAEHLRRRGYKTRWFGPLDDIHLDLRAGYARGFDDLEHPGGGIFTAAEAWLSSRPAGPFFAFVHTYHVHDPYFPEPSSLARIGAPAASRWSSRRELDASIAAAILANPRLIFREETLAEYHYLFAQPSPDWSRIGPLMDSPQNTHTFFYTLRQRAYWEKVDVSSAPDMAEQRVRYDALVWEADEAFGRLMDALKRAGLAERTVVILTSDHGEEFMEHGRTMHSQLYAETLHVPILVIAPGAAVGISSEVVQSVDILPTVLELIGAPRPSKLDGISLVPALTGAGLPPGKLAFAFVRDQFAVRDARWSYIATLGSGGRPDKEELYDRDADPGERRNLLGGDGMEAADKAAAFRALIPRPLPDHKGRWPADVDAAARKKLLETGYW